MAYTESNMIPLGTVAPDFNLLNPATEQMLGLQAIAKDAKATVIMFLCNHCPYVLYINPEIARVVATYKAQGVAFVGISSNDAENYPEDAPALMPAHATAVGYDFPYLYDETQAVARAYDAACTPDFYVFDRNMNLAYRGRPLWRFRRRGGHGGDSCGARCRDHLFRYRPFLWKWPC